MAATTFRLSVLARARRERIPCTTNLTPVRLCTGWFSSAERSPSLRFPGRETDRAGVIETRRCIRMEGKGPADKFVYDFAEGNKDLKDLLGGKGANLAEMTNLGLPVPAGFTITTVACQRFLTDGSHVDGLDEEIDRHLTALEAQMGRRLGDPADPLLVSVRSGAKFSMP